MNINAIRGKKKIQKTLQSIPMNHNNNAPMFHLKLNTQTPQKIQWNIRQYKALKIIDSTHKDEHVRKTPNRFYRYKSNESSKDTQVNKYQSLQITNRGLKRSQQKLNFGKSINFNSSDHKSGRYKKSQKKLQAASIIADRYGANLFTRQSRRSHFYKKGHLSGQKLREGAIQRFKSVESCQPQKQLAIKQFKKQNYIEALRLFQLIPLGKQYDLEVLELKSLCLMNLKRYMQAILVLNIIVQLDPFNSQKKYIYLALCENQRNRSEACMQYIEKCIQLFPQYYEAYYLKGKILFKHNLLEDAIDSLRKAMKFNTSKKQIPLLLAQCYQKKGNFQKAMNLYSQNINVIDGKSVKYGIRYAFLLLELKRDNQGSQILQKCSSFIQNSSYKSGYQQHMIQISYLLSLVYFRKKNFQNCCIRGQQIIKSGHKQWMAKSFKIMITTKIIERNFYAANYLIQRIVFLNMQTDILVQCMAFCEGVILLMKKKTHQALIKFKQLESKFSSKKQLDQFNNQIYKVYHLYLIFAYFLLGNYQKTLKHIAKQRKIYQNNDITISLNYNQLVCRGIIIYNQKKYDEAFQLFKKSLNVCPEKPESHLYIALINYKRYFQNNAQQKIIIHNQIRQYLTICADYFRQTNHNYSAYLFYYIGMFHAWQGQWVLAAQNLDLAIQKSQDNYLPFFYLRSLVMANLHNYKQAINDVSLALSIQEEDADCYMLRARCLQVQGNPNQAFADLQAYIALRPDDKHIHTFAGHLLFQNGAFEDALQAYNQEPIQLDDIQAFLTRGKAHFLLDMMTAWKQSNQCQQFLFDAQMMRWMKKLFHQYDKDGKQDDYSFNDHQLQKSLIEIDEMYLSKGQSHRYGKVFKLTQYLSLRSICLFFLGKFDLVIETLLQVIQLKQLSMQGDADGDFQQEQSDKIIFINQMYYNIALTYCVLKDYPNAIKMISNCTINHELHGYKVLEELIDQISGQKQVNPSEEYTDVFTMRNKISKFIPQTKIPFQYKKTKAVSYRSMKICIPYPKVQPPDINPRFDQNLIKNVDLNLIQRKPEAPWICKQDNAIKFTDKMQVFSRFQMEKSEVDKQPTQKYIKQPIQSFEDLPPDVDIKKHLRLDSDIQEKLERMMKKNDRK